MRNHSLRAGNKYFNSTMNWPPVEEIDVKFCNMDDKKCQTTGPVPLITAAREGGFLKNFIDFYKYPVI